jgi:hypothetical protein
MSIDEHHRHQLHSRLTDLRGPDEADTLMEHLPPVGWADVATKQDLAHTEALLRQDLAHTEALMREGLAHTEALVQEGLAHTESLLRAELRAEVSSLDANLGHQFDKQNHLIIGALVTYGVTLLSIVGAATFA